jgi:DNA repair exonuclease SbcCD ATPase subunit
MGGALPVDHVQAAADQTRASDFLAQLTNGDLVRLVLVGKGRQVCAVNREGATIAVEQLSGAQRDQAYLSMCLALHSAASRQALWLPLVLDEPFERLSARGTAALVAVLDVFCRQGHQVIVFTQKQDATERLVSIGAAVHNIASLRRWRGELETVAEVAPQPPMTMAAPKQVIVKRTKRVRNTEIQSTEEPNASARRRKKKPVDRSDAA